MNNSYIGLTIGPIYKTINASQRTRMLWGASFLFSFLIKELVKLLKTGILMSINHPECKIEGKILIPFSDKIEEDTCISGEGKYPDRILIHSKEGDFNKVQRAITILIQYMGQEIARHLNKQGEKEQVINDLSDYFQFYFIEKKIGDSENALLSLYNDLDVLELRGKYLASNENNYLFYYLFYLSIRNKKSGYSILARDAFPKAENKRFRSLIEIATAGYINSIDKDEYEKLITESFIKHALQDVPETDPFRDKKFNDDDDKQDEFIKALKTGKDGENKSLFTIPFKKHHQYIAVIYADGDNIGATLREIGNDEIKLENFSKKLVKFDGEVVKLIKDYGGAPVYIGGEDIFAFVPLASIKDGKRETIFDLIRTIDAAFKKPEYFSEDYANELKVVRPTLSFGVAIAYYKHPLYETMTMARDLLHKKAKKRPDKNAIELVLQEHSGQQFRLSVLKNKKSSYNTICGLMDSLTSKVFSKDDQQEKTFINSITHKFKDPLFRVLLLAVGCDRSRLDEFFKNSFNEPIHRGEMKDYLANVKDLITDVYNDYGDDDTRIQNIYSTLRLIDFMHKDPKEE